MTYDIGLRNAHVIDPSQNLHRVLDVGIHAGRIAGLGQIAAAPDAQEIDLRGRLRTAAGKTAVGAKGKVLVAERL